jgi:hypothetical protein
MKKKYNIFDLVGVLGYNLASFDNWRLQGGEG